ncbi:MAG: SAM-dependent methyltransferase [Streptosporangiales bacterium]|nr:SAM-dependent methyltransferase [Streptosporangiales bacterium]MBO0890048.1 SAM-dependent methyltransferase [Acidothermales bacterium]
MSANESAPGGIDTSTPSIARVYDAMLGGKDNFAVDRQLYDRLIELNPDLPRVMRANRRWQQRVVRWLAGTAGIDQFLDLGSGLPTVQNTHEVAHLVSRDARVVYVDNDPTVVAHGRVLLEDHEYTYFVPGDLTNPAALLSDSGVVDHLDLDRPMAVLQCATLHFIPEQAEAERIMRGYTDRLATGSYVGIVHAEMPEPGDGRYETYLPSVAKYREAIPAFTPRTHADVTALFEGLELVEPGVVPLDDWWPDGPRVTPMTGLGQLSLGGVARKP